MSRESFSMETMVSSTEKILWDIRITTESKDVRDAIIDIMTNKFGGYFGGRND